MTMEWGGDVLINKSVRSDKNIVSDGDAPHNDRVGSDPYIVSDDWRANPFAAILLTNGDTFMEVAVFAEPGPRVDGNGMGMTKVKPGTNIASISDL